MKDEHEYEPSDDELAWLAVQPEPSDDEMQAAGDWYAEHGPRPPVRVADLVGDRVGDVRRSADVTQERVAEEARRLGLTWVRTSVATLEAGRRLVSVEELALLPLILSRACGRTVTLAQLLPDDVDIALVGDSRCVVDGSELRSMLGGRPIEREVDSPSPPEPPFGDELPSPDFEVPEHLSSMWPGLTGQPLREACTRVPQVADTKAAKSLGVPVRHVIAACYALWNRSLTDERNARAAEAGLPDARRARQSTLGIVTRRLLVELRAELHAADERRVSGGDRGKR